MDLVTALAATRGLADLPAVVAALGHEPLWDEIPVGRWLEGALWADRFSRAAMVGRIGDWPWWGVECDAPAEAVPRLARHLTVRGRFGGILGLCARSRTLVVSAAADPAPVLAVPLDAPDRFAVTTLRRAAADPRPGPLAQSLHVADALARRQVDRRFFEAFRTTRDRLAASLAVPDADDRNALALLHLTRVLFLYFIQAKGWLDGREDFLAAAVERCLRRGRPVHRDLLRPLFFGTLNRPVGERGPGPRAFGRIPFLNGGLFEPHPLERRWRAEPRADAWRDAFDGLFERFAFTATEGEGDQVAPGMLGRVFEGLMAADQRRASGTFYTPPALVARVTDVALTTFLARRLDLPWETARGRLDDPDPAARHALRTLTLLDPAVGSGAFLLGALERLAQVLTDGNATATRRGILRANLFGVDLDPTAVRLAELRLWLAVVSQDPAGPGDAVEPLPNLDCVVRQGDSLRDPVLLASVPAECAAELRAARRTALDASGPAKRAAIGALRRVERRAAEGALAATVARAEREIGECLALARSPTLFGSRRGLDGGLARRLRELRAFRRNARALQRQVARDAALPWFHYQSHFADVFARGGFDVVVGNPPWVRAEELPPERRRELTERYRWWRRAAGRGFGHQGDISVAFVERALELAAPDGVVALLVPGKLATAGYGGRLRHAVATAHSVVIAADLAGDPSATFDATVYPFALVVAKSPAPPRTETRLTLDPQAPVVRQAELATTGPWILRSPAAAAVARELAERFPPLAGSVSIHLGVKTGHNAAFLGPPGFVADHLTRPALRGRDLRAFAASPVRRLLWTHDDDGRPLGRLPAEAARHLARWQEALARRADVSDAPWWSLFRLAGALARHRVAWPDVARRLTAAALPAPTEAVPLNTCYVAVTPNGGAAHALAAWLNATPIRALARLRADPAMSGFARFNARTVGAVPFPPAALNDPGLGELGLAGAAGQLDQEVLDAHVARLLDLGAARCRALAVALGPPHRG